MLLILALLTFNLFSIYFFESKTKKILSFHSFYIIYIFEHFYLYTIVMDVVLDDTLIDGCSIKCLNVSRYWNTSINYLQTDVTDLVRTPARHFRNIK